MAPPAELAPPAAATAGGRAIARALILALGLAAAGLLLRGIGPAALRDLQPGARGVALMLIGGALLSAAGVPRSITAAAAGYGFGLAPGLGLAMAAQLAGCLLTTLWARLVAQDWARRRLRGRWARLLAVLTGRPFMATLTLRLAPVGSNLAVNLAAGLAGLPLAPFMAATLFGYLPQTAVFCALGAGVHVGRGAQLALAAALFAASAALGLALARSQPALADPTSPPPPHARPETPQGAP